MSNKKKGSNNFKKCQTHRKNYINWSINQLNLTDVKQVNIEKIKDLRKLKEDFKKLCSGDKITAKVSIIKISNKICFPASQHICVQEKVLIQEKILIY